jgi:hypothetical protein
MSDKIDSLPTGRSQLHELRTLALQYVGGQRMGWQTTISRLVSLSWSGLNEVEDNQRWLPRGKRVVNTEEQACAVVESLSHRASARNVRLYMGFVRDLRGETTRL